MPTSMADCSPIYDLVGIGFGPAQIATAIANREARKSSNVLFLERRPSFSWPSAHLVRTRMETPFVYDLATIRNPRSAFTYVNYLLARSRLVEFANSDRLNPLRMEFEDYLRWCAEQFNDQVRYEHEVIGVAPAGGESPVRCWNVVVKDKNGKTTIVQARNILAPSVKGEQKPHVLNSVDFLAGQRIVATTDYLSRRNELWARRKTPLNIAIVGSGQQTVEILADLLACPRLGNITMVTEDETLAPLRILNDDPEPPTPQLCSIWASPACKQKSTVTGSSELLQAIYGRGYEKKVASKGAYNLRVVIGQDAAAACSQAEIIIAEQAVRKLSSSGLFESVDSLVLGCRQKGDSLEEVHFRRGAVSENCRMWLLSAHSEGGRSLARDLAQRTGEIVSALTVGDESRTRVEGRIVAARI
jgi:L-ornithine N5-oxygenase